MWKASTIVTVNGFTPCGRYQILKVSELFSQFPWTVLKFYFLFSGVGHLSSAEVSRDLEDLIALREAVNDGDETDSDGSVASVDILRSAYPVRPRVHPKIIRRGDSTSFANRISQLTSRGDRDQVTGVEVEESLAFLKKMGKLHPALIELETIREKLENSCQASHHLH